MVAILSQKPAKLITRSGTAALVEVSGKGIGVAPEPSLGTHFFQVLMEAQIYPLAVNLDQAEAAFRRDFFYDTPNRLAAAYLAPDGQ